MSSECSLRSVRHLLAIVSNASWSFSRLSQLLLKYLLFLSLLHSHLSVDFHLSSPSSLFSPLLPPRCCVHCSSPSHRYLTPRHKAEFCDVTKWVEDVNRNTQGPYIRYYLRLRPLTPYTHTPTPQTHTFSLLCQRMINSNNSVLFLVYLSDSSSHKG